MKYFYSIIITLLMSVIAFAQQPIITAIVDGDCSGGNPKVIEIYASGTVDFALYSVENQSNANTTWVGTTSLAPLGVVTNGFVYLTTTGSAASLAAEFPGITTTNQLATNTANNNGDDRVRLINAAMAVVDQYGAEGVDGTGEVWEYLDGFSKRVSGTGPDAVFNPANWTYNNNSLDTFGTCQGGADTFQTIMGGIGTYSTTPNTSPTLSIQSPTTGSTLDSGNFNVTLSVTNFVVAASGGNGYITYQLDSNAAVDKFNTTPISFTNVAPGAHTIAISLVNNTGAALNPAVSTSINVIVSNNIQVQDIAALRAVTLPSSDIYTLSNEAIITQTQSFRNQKWIQDASAAIVIDDPSGVVTTASTIGDGLSGISGRLNEFNGLLQFTPTTDTGAPSSTGNAVTPQAVTIAMLNANPENFESEFVEIQNAVFSNADGTTAFANNVEQAFTVATAAYNMRPASGASYIATVIPAGVTSIAGVILQRNNTEYTISPRNSGDISTLSTDTTTKAVFSIYPNPVKSGGFNVVSSSGEQVDITLYSVLGQEVGSFRNVTSTINVNSLNAGVYIVKIAQGSSIETRKLIVE